MQIGYALFFHRLLFNMCDVARSGIRGDTRKAYYCEVEIFSNIYGMQFVIGGEYGLKFLDMLMYELVWWERLEKIDGVRGN